MATIAVVGLVGAASTIGCAADGVVTGTAADTGLRLPVGPTATTCKIIRRRLKRQRFRDSMPCFFPNSSPILIREYAVCLSTRLYGRAAHRRQVGGARPQAWHGAVVGFGAIDRLDAVAAARRGGAQCDVVSGIGPACGGRCDDCSGCGGAGGCGAIQHRMGSGWGGDRYRCRHNTDATARANGDGLHMKQD